MGWLIFWLVVAAYWAIGIKRMPVYYNRAFAHNRKEWSSIRTVEQAQKESAWVCLGIASVWPYYEGGRWLRDHIVHTMTAEQRRQQEYENAEKIVAEYKKNKEREEHEAFDRALRGSK